VKEAIIMMGPSGGGKSTWLKEQGLESEGDWTVEICSADSYFTDAEGNYNFDVEKLSKAHAQCLRKFISSCSSHVETVVCDNTNTTMQEIAPYMAVAQAFGYSVRVILCIGTQKECTERNVHGVPTEVVYRQIDRMHELLNQWPSYWPLWRQA
jgi:predicted kinase